MPREKAAGFVGDLGAVGGEAMVAIAPEAEFEGGERGLFDQSKRVLPGDDIVVETVEDQGGGAPVGGEVGGVELVSFCDEFPGEFDVEPLVAEAPSAVVLPAPAFIVVELEEFAVKEMKGRGEESDGGDGVGSAQGEPGRGEAAHAGADEKEALDAAGAQVVANDVEIFEEARGTKVEHVAGRSAVGVEIEGGVAVTVGETGSMEGLGLFAGVIGAESVDVEEGGGCAGEVDRAAEVSTGGMGQLH